MLIVAINGLQFIISICGLLDNMLLIYMLKHRRPFTANVRFLLRIAAVCHCILTGFVVIKSLLVMLSISLDFDIVMPKIPCFVVSGIFYGVPLQISALSIWLILVERLYASLRFKENVELSKQSGM
jgi:hypothetical protein